VSLITNEELIAVKITFEFKGSVFNQKEKIILSLKEKLSVIDALRELASEKLSLKPLLFKEDSLRNDILVFVDRTDIVSMKLLDMPLEDGQQITILPLAHGG
jgi:molybdopterin converting factor small subunit